MDTSENLSLIFIGIIIVLNVLASVSLLRSSFYDRPQKLIQCTIIWLLPVIGAVAIWIFLRVQYNWQKYDTRAYPERTEKMISVVINNSIHENTGSGVPGD